MPSITKLFNWKVALIWHTIFFSFAMLQKLPILGMLWLIINTFVCLLLLRAVYCPDEDKNSNRAMAWYFYILSIFTDLLSLCVFGQHIVDERLFLAVFVLIMAVFILLPKPLFAYFLFKSLRSDGFHVMKGLNFENSTKNDDGGGYVSITGLDDMDSRQEIEQQNLKKKMMSCEPENVIPPEIAQEPKEGARAFFSDALIGPNGPIPYDKNCPWSDYVGEGSYPKNREAFPKATSGTFDGIAVDSNTRVILWEKENFEGKVLLDVIGPKIINNMKIYSSQNEFAFHKEFGDAEMQKNYPVNVRVWSETDMNSWTNGSVKIVAAP